MAMDNLKESECKALEELKQCFSPEIRKKKFAHDFYFFRFLKDKNFNVNSAEVAVRNNIEWRQKMKIDTMLQEFTPHEFFMNLFENIQFAYDKNQNNVFYVEFSALDVVGFLKSFPYKEIEKAVVYAHEKHAQRLSNLWNKPNGETGLSIIIINTQNLTFAKATSLKTVETALRLEKTFRNNYPGIFKAIIIINASQYAVMGYNLIRRVLHPSITEKLSIFGENGYQEEFLKLIDADKLPKFLGGNLTGPDGDPLCKTLLHRCEIIPEKFYMKNSSKKSLMRSDSFEKLVLSRASFYEIEIVVNDADSAIQWEFEIKSRDVGFGLFHKEVVNGEDKITELVALMRLDTEDFSESGVYNCDKTGTYVIVFDNSYSWIRSKEIFYKISVVSLNDLGQNMTNAKLEE